jgi:nucleotide-binding universal stress UspA family protein
MFEKVLVAVDHSEVAQRALAAAKDLALLSKGEVWVLHLREREVIAQLGDVPSESAADAKSPVSAAVEELTKAGVTAHGEVRDTTFGHAAREIMQDASEHDVGVIVMGSRGRSDLAGLVLGSTAHKVIHLSDRPVLVIR